MKQRSSGQQRGGGDGVGMPEHLSVGGGDERLDDTDHGHWLVMMQQGARALDAEVTRRKALEVALGDALAREAAAADVRARYHDLFAGMLGHDLRNALGAMMMNADYIARLNLGDKPTRNAGRISTTAVRMSRMIDQLLDFAQIWVGGGLVLAPAWVELAPLCARVRDELEADHPAWSIVVETVGDTAGQWDADGVLRVLVTLVGNAITHGTGAQVALRVDGAAASELVIEVHNAGVIPPRIAATLFEPRGADKPRFRADGLGLGLFISRQIVEAHGGTIAISSSEPRGTTARVTLPRELPTTDRG